MPPGTPSHRPRAFPRASGYTPCRRSSQYLEIARQRFHRRPRIQRVEHRGAQPVEPVVGIGLLRPFVEQFGEVAQIPERVDVFVVPPFSSVRAGVSYVGAGFSYVGAGFSYVGGRL
jgi:hypothetical protein